MLAYHELFENFGNGTSLLTPEQVLTQVSLQWLTNTAAGATRLHYTEKSVEPQVNHGPIGVAVFADDFRSMRPVRRARQHRHRVLDRAPTRRSLRGHGGSRGARRDDPGLLPRAAPRVRT